MQYSIVNYKELENESLRLDSEFYRPVFLETEREVKKHSWDYLKNVSATIRSFGAYSLNNQFEYQNQGIPFLRCKDIQDGFINLSDVLYIDNVANKLLWKSEIKPETVLFTMSGTVGNTALATEDLQYPLNSNQDIAKIRTNNKLNPFYLTVFLNSRYGKLQTERLPIGSIQQHIFLWQIDKLEIPLFSDGFQGKIKKIFKQSLQVKQNSKSLYSQAEQLLLSELGLLDWEQKHTLAFVKDFSATLEAERIDAEYFQPKYEEIVEAVKNYKGGFDIVSGQFKQNKKSFKKVLDKEYQYVEIGCVNVSDGSMEPMKLQGSELPANAKIKFQKGDVIISKVRPYRGAIGIVDSEDYVGSGAFTVLQGNGVVNKETLMVFLRLKPLLDFSLKFNTGTSYPTITDEDIFNFLLPKIDSKTQEEIRKKIVEMYETKKLSKSLLEIAKRGVEMAIEKDEQEAEMWINDEVEKLGIKL